MTYSIVAYDKKTMQFGVGVQTHQPAVGAVVPWVQAGVGVVATQSLTNIAFGPLGLELLGTGMAADKALAALLASDEGREQRQVALVDRKGKVAAHTGSKCIPFAGQHVGKGYSVQANMMLKDTVIPAMQKAFEGAEGALLHRIMVALEAAEGEGGDIRGSQSAAIVVYGSEDKPHWENRVADLRVDEHRDPIGELRRIVDLRLADLRSNAAHALAEKKDKLNDAIQEFAEARAMSADASEMLFWQALVLADNHGQVEQARALLQPLFKAEPNWRELVRRLAPVGLIDHPEIVEQLLKEQSP